MELYNDLHIHRVSLSSDSLDSYTFDGEDAVMAEQPLSLPNIIPGALPNLPGSPTSTCSSSSESDTRQWEDSVQSSTKTPADLSQNDVVSGMTKLLQRLCTANETRVLLENVSDNTRMFFSVRKPPVALDVYIRRLVKHIRCSVSVFVLAVVYISRLEQKRQSLGVTSYNIHRIVTTAVLLAAKFAEDTHFSNLHFARAGGVATVDEMNRLEATALQVLDFDVFVGSEEFQSVESLLESWAHEK